MDQQAGQEMLHGTLDVLVLKTLSWGPRHGYAIARWLEEATGDALAVGEGSLYPPSTAWSAAGGSAPSGGCRSSGGGRSSTGSPTRGAPSSSGQTAQWADFTRLVARVLLPEGGALTWAAR
jgi:hypothetical protein